MLASRGWFVEDDLWNLTVASDLGWGWDLLGRDVFGHVSPGFNALLWLVAGPGDGRYGMAVAEIAVLSAAVPLSVAAAARALGARPWPAVVASAVATTSVVAASASTWWTAALVVLPSLLGAAWTVVGIGRARQGRADGAWIAAAGLLVGMSASEGAAVVLLLAVALAAAPGPGPGPGSRLHRIRWAWGAPWRWWVVLAPFAAAAAVRASASTPVSGSPPPGPVALAEFPVVFAVRGLLPTFGGLAANRVEAFGSPAATVLVGLVVTAVLVAVLSPHLEPGAGWALGGVALIVLVRGAVVAWGRLSILGWERAVEVRYVADLGWLVPVVVAAWWRAPEPPAIGEPRIVRGPTVAISALLVAGLVGQVVLAGRAPSSTSRAYRERLQASWSDRPAGASVVDVAVPSRILGPQFGEFVFLSRTFDRDGLDLRYRPSAQLLAPDGSGTLHPVSLGPLTELAVGDAFTAVGQPPVRHDDGCWVAGAVAATVWVPLVRPVTLAAYVLDLQLSGSSSTGVALSAAGSAPTAAVGTSAKGRGARRWLVSTAPFEAAQLGFAIPAGDRLCLRSGHVATPVVVP